MPSFYIYNLKKYFLFNNLITKYLKNKKIILLCIGNSNFIYDDFGVKMGDTLKSLNFYCFGSSIREVNGLNFLQVYKYLKNKFPDYKIVIFDSVFCKNNKPVLIFNKGGVNVSGINSNLTIGDYGILFNSFSYSNINLKNKIIKLLRKSFLKLSK